MILKFTYNQYLKFKQRKLLHIYKTFKDYTMIPKETYIQNLVLIDRLKKTDGCIVECGTWRGGMIGGIATMLGNKRNYFLFDSFEGLPKAQQIDGESAIQWQKDINSPTYFDNCKAEIIHAEEAMKLSNVTNFYIHKGWFSETLPKFSKNEKIAILRLDGDWYESTMDCLENLYDAVFIGGIIILDDYYAWSGCSRAVHDFLSKHSLPDRIYQWDNSICYIVKQSND